MITGFSGSYRANSIVLEWSTASEINNFGFEIERSTNQTDWRIVGFKEGNGTTTELQNYSFVDNLSEIDFTKLYYRLKQVDFNGNFEYSSIAVVEITPSRFELFQNYPNPFNPITKITYSIPKVSFITLKVYDLLGREIKTLVNEFRQPGVFSIDFNTEGLSSGIYFYKLKAGEFTETKKMILMK